MKKLFNIWRRKDEPHSSCFHLPTGQAIIGPSTYPGYNLRDKGLKKLHQAAAVGDLEKVMKYLRLKKQDVNMQDREHR